MISDDTIIIPEAVASMVVNEAEVYRSLNVPEGAAGELVTHAEEVYKNNLTFRKKIRQKNAEKARDHLYAFMRHWLDAMIKRGETRARRTL